MQPIVWWSVLSVIANSGRKWRWNRFSIPRINSGRLLTVSQHYDAKHLFKCSVCDAKFNTQAGVNQVTRFLTPVLFPRVHMEL